MMGNSCLYRLKRLGWIWNQPFLSEATVSTLSLMIPITRAMWEPVSKY